MDLNQKIAQRRAQLQQEQEVEDAHKKEEAHQQFLQKETERKALERLAAKDAAARIEVMEAQLSGSKADAPIPLVADQRVSELADKKVEAHIRKLAQGRFTPGQELICAIFFVCGIWGFFEAWWLGLGLWVAGGFYASRIASRYEAKIRSELNQGGKE